MAAVLVVGCALPPPVEERPLDAGVEASMPRVDSSLSRGVDGGGARSDLAVTAGEKGEAGATGEAGAGGVDSPEAGVADVPESGDARPLKDADTDVIEVQASASSPIRRVGDAEDTVVEEPSGGEAAADGAVRRGGPETAANSPDARGGQPADDPGDPRAMVIGDHAGAAPREGAPARGEQAGEDAQDRGLPAGRASRSATDGVAGSGGEAAPAGAGDVAADSAADGAPERTPGEVADWSVATGAEPDRTAGADAPADAIERRRLAPAEGEGPGPSYLAGGAAGARAVIFIHTWCGEAEQWRAEMERLAPERRVLAIDLPGHGQSVDVPREVWTIPGYAADVAALLRAEDVEAAVLVGHGMGGKVALEVAARAPGRVEAVVGVDSLQALAGDPNPGIYQEYVERFRADFPREMSQFVASVVGDDTPVELTERIARDAQVADEEAALALIGHFGQYDVREVTRNVQCTVVCINSAVQATDVEGNRALLSSFDVRLLEGVGHWVHLEAPGRFHDELVSLLDSFARSGAPSAPDVAPVPAASSAPAVRSIGPLVVGEDAEALADFYVDLLGFEVASREPADGAQPASSLRLVREGARLDVLSLTAYRAGLGDLGPDAPAPRATFTVEVARLEPVVARARAAEALAAEPRERSGGGRRAVLRDPTGNLVLVDAPAERDGGG